MEQRKGRIVRSLSGFYEVAASDGRYTCKGRGTLRRARVVPLTGDEVLFTPNGSGGTVDAVLPRKNCFVRPAVANIDLLVIFASNVNPVTEPFLIDRVAAIALGQGVETLLCVNKGDLDPAHSLMGIYTRAGFPVLRTSAATGEGVEQLRAQLRGRTAAFTGNSGVGKSSMLNALCPALALPTGEVSEKLGRGRHTTRHVELYALGDDTFVADTPGFAAFDTDEMDTLLTQNLPSAFPDFEKALGACRFRDCTHRAEPDCAVRGAVAAGLIEPTRYESYLRLYEQAQAAKPW